jgi:hypothetical protein
MLVLSVQGAVVCCRVPATSAGGGNVPVLSGQRHRSSGRSSGEGDPRRRFSTDEAVAAANAAAAAGGRSRMRPGASGELSSQVGPPAGSLQLAVLHSVGWWTSCSSSTVGRRC